MSDMEIEDEGVSSENVYTFEWVSYVDVPHVGKILKCINGNPVEWLDDFPKAKEKINLDDPQGYEEEEEGELLEEIQEENEEKENE